ncbi:hypothetical protein CDV36_002545 [Fusarium kuroshium]|uniref:Arrestin C-terminal-like domain-containing protein n=1 Tax=Fusarium kuroshium TaxID=2010991 RepID=A0A3M2SJT4_9HYPO|nr:hypothetical protein CDV36_002545 [Fusarium kuroshium]
MPPLPTYGHPIYKNQNLSYIGQIRATKTPPSTPVPTEYKMQSVHSLLARLIGTPRVRVTIRPDRDFVFLSGVEDEAAGDYIRGTLALCLLDDQPVQDVQLEMIGEIAIASHKSNTDEQVGSWLRSVIFSYKWEPFTFTTAHGPASSSRHHHMREYTWPFEFYIPGDLPESLRGCSQCHISYRLVASFLRGAAPPDVGDFVPISVIRKPRALAFDMMDPWTVQGTWARSVEYQFCIAHQAIALGTFVPVELTINNLGRDMRVSKLKCALQEIHEVKEGAFPTIAAFKGQREAMKWELPTTTEENQPYHTQLRLSLPRLLRKCSPDFDIQGIVIKHKLQVIVTIRHSHGFTSEHCASLPIILFISSERPVDGWGRFIEPSHSNGNDGQSMLSPSLSAPPQYTAAEVESSFEFDRSHPPPYSP